MKITQVSVLFAETCSLPEYCNVKPAVGYTAVLEDGDDPEAVRRTLLDKAKSQVHDEVDAALEASNCPPKYYSGPRVQLMGSYRNKIFVLLPDSMNSNWPENITHLTEIRRGQRPETGDLIGRAMATERGWQYFDCSDGNLQPLQDYLELQATIEEDKEIAVDEEKFMED